MKAKGRFISLLMIVNALLGGYAAGLNSRHDDVVDPSLAPLPATGAAPEKKRTELPLSKVSAVNSENKDKKTTLHHGAGKKSGHGKQGQSKSKSHSVGKETAASD